MAVKRTYTSSPWGFRMVSMDKFCRFMRSIGIVDLCSMFGPASRFPLNVEPDAKSVAEARRIAESHGVRFTEISTTRHYETEVPLAAQLGVDYLRVCEVWPDTPETRRMLIADLKKAGDLCAPHGIRVIVENHGGLLTKAGECRAILDEVGRENVGLNYDPANFLFYGDDPLAAIDVLRKRIFFTHFKSVRIAQGKASYCRLRDGLLDYPAILKSLLKSYKGPLGLEYEEPGDCEQGTKDDFENLRAWIAKAGKSAKRPAPKKKAKK